MSQYRVPELVDHGTVTIVTRTITDGLTLEAVSPPQLRMDSKDAHCPDDTEGSETTSGEN